MAKPEPVNILLVDDQPSNLTALASFLDSPDYHLVLANSGAEALRHVLQTEFAAIVMDVRMPIMDGFECARLIKQREICRNVPILFVTATPDTSKLAADGYATGAVDYLIKPVDPFILRSKIGVFVKLHRRTIELRAVNEALQAEMAARARLQSDLERHFRVAQDLVCIAGFDGYFRQLNPAWKETLGWTEAELTARPFVEFVHPDDRETTSREAAKLAEGGVLVSFENRYRCRDGSYRWLLWNATGDVDRQLIYGAARDITGRKEAEEKLQQVNAELERQALQLHTANKELEAFSYSVSHDLRAPLRHLQGFGAMLTREAGDQLSDKARDYLKTITDASKEMSALIDDLLAFSRMGRAQMAETSVPLGALAQEALRGLETATRGRNITWRIPPLPVVQGDPPMLKQVFANLLGNAVKYTRPRDPAVIEIGCDGEEDGRLILFVRDNGVGFDPQFAHKLFGVFQRLHSADEFEGTGIGLANVRRIIGRHGGRTWAEGKVGEGATFYFTLKPAKAGAE